MKCPHNPYSSDYVLMIPPLLYVPPLLQFWAFRHRRVLLLGPILLTLVVLGMLLLISIAVCVILFRLLLWMLAFLRILLQGQMLFSPPACILLATLMTR